MAFSLIRDFPSLLSIDRISSVRVLIPENSDQFPGLIHDLDSDLISIYGVFSGKILCEI